MIAMLHAIAQLDLELDAVCKSVIQMQGQPAGWLACLYIFENST
jgi:hypothetical protein